MEDGTPDVATTSWGYARLRDRSDLDSELDGRAAALARPGWDEAFAYLEHEETGLGPAPAAQLSACLAARRASADRVD
jgi:hypothetical protein